MKENVKIVINNIFILRDADEEIHMFQNFVEAVIWAYN